MNNAEPTLDNLAGLSESARERIRESRLEAWYQTNQGQKARTFHPLNFRSGPKWEVWQDEKHLGHGMNGSLVVQQRKIEPPPPHGNMSAPELRAVKIIPVYDGRSKYYLRELESMIKFSHQAYSNLFVRFLGWYKFDHRLHIISEYCELGDLANYLKERNGRLPEDQVKDISWQVLQGVRAMHKEGCVHGDIKPSNILVIKHPPDYWWVKVCDLGLSKRVEQSRGTTSTHYSRGFCPPEKLRLFDDNDDAIDGYKADIWCFGEFVFQALTGQATFKSTTDVDKWCRSGTGFPDQRLRDTGASEDVVNFLHSLMVSEPSKRLTAAEACEHRWMRKEPHVPAPHPPPTHHPPVASVSRGWKPELWTPAASTPRFPPPYGQYGIHSYGSNSTPVTTSPYPAPMMPMSTVGARPMGLQMSYFDGPLYRPWYGMYDVNGNGGIRYGSPSPFAQPWPSGPNGSGQAWPPPRRGSFLPFPQEYHGQGQVSQSQPAGLNTPVTPLPSFPQDQEVKGSHSRQSSQPTSKDPEKILKGKVPSTNASKEVVKVEKNKRHSTDQTREARISELKEFAKSFKLPNPIPTNLVDIVRKETVLSVLQQGQEMVKQHVAADQETHERVKGGSTTPLANSSEPSIEGSAGEYPRRITTSKPMTWAERVAQQPAPRPVSVDSSGVPDVATVEVVGPRAKATEHMDGNSDEQDQDFHGKNATGSRPSVIRIVQGQERGGRRHYLGGNRGGR